MKTPAHPSNNPQVKALAPALEGRYTIQREIGRGGMATVYLAEDCRHGRKVALKILRAELAESVREERFLREIRIAAQLTHPHILQLFDSGEYDGVLFYVMPYVDGESLRELLVREKELAVDRALRLTREMLGALGYAHARGFVHRDVKPENILLMDGHALVADFGIARVADATATPITETGLTVGSPLYMSPEQGAGERNIDGRSDLYAVGCLLFEMLVGLPPFRADTAVQIIWRHTSFPIPSAHAVRSEVSSDLDAVITRALAKNPDDRFPSALAFRIALDAAAATQQGQLNKIAAFNVRENGPSVDSRNGRAKIPALSVASSVAVMPFTDLSPTRDAEFLCDGVTEDLREALSRVAGLTVASRTSTAEYKGKAIDARDVGRNLNVATLLQGSIKPIDDRLQLATTLTSTSDGLQVWSKEYERDAKGIFALQDEIAHAVIDSLRPRISVPQRAIVSRTTDNIEAYQLFLRGRHFWARREEGGLQKAVECYRQAMEIDPLYVMPYVGLADAYNTFGAYEYLPPREAFPRVLAAARRALSIDPTMAEAHTALGSARAHYLWEWRGAEESLHDAIGLNPQYALAQAYHALMLSATGRHERAKDAMARAYQLDPLSHIFTALVGWVAFYGRRLDDAIHQYKIAIEMEPKFPVVHSFLGFAYLAVDRVEEAVNEFALIRGFRTGLGGLGNALARAGRTDEARNVLDEMDSFAQGSYVSSFSRSMVHLGLGERGKALDALEAGLEERAYTMSYIAVHPICDPLRSEPRFAAILERMGLSDVPGAIVKT